MTIDEKVGQLTQLTGMWEGEAENRKIHPELLERIRNGSVGSLLNVHGAEITRQVQTAAVEESRLGIPLILGLDVIHGFRTIFPIPLAEAATWDPDVVERSARVSAVEATAAGLHWTFAPMVDIARDARWGRIAEGSGEDPYLGSVMAAARVRGFQGSDLSLKNTLAACPKHFAAYGGAEGGRDYNTVDISERTLREIYLPPFRAAVRAGAATLMCSFNEIAGIPSSANQQLLTTILRHEWGFDGFVVSDWNSIGELQIHGVASTAADAARKSLRAGVDMDMESKAYNRELSRLVRSNMVPASDLDEAVRRVLRIKYRLGLFADPYRYCDAEREKSEILSPMHLAAAREVAQKAIVLLKNDGNILPLKKSLRRIAVLGPLADNNRDPLGTWAADGRPEQVVSVLEGIRQALPSGAEVLYAKGCEIQGFETAAIDEAVAVARRAEVALIVVGEAKDMSGEGACRSFLGLPGKQEELVKAVAASGTPTVVILMNGRPLALGSLVDTVPAIVEAWFLGVQTGHAVADVVFGDVNPGGKLPATFPRTTGQVPVYYDHKPTGRPGNDNQSFNSRYLDVPTAPLFPFGYGLSYTRFEYEDVRVHQDCISAFDTLVVSVRVRNAGDRPGDEVVQLYVRDVVARVTRPVKELKGFARIHLQPGEEKTVTFSVPPEHLAYYDEELRFVLEPGQFDVFVGTNSADGLRRRFEVVGNERLWLSGS
jgi:beta-glucosidase